MLYMYPCRNSNRESSSTAEDLGNRQRPLRVFGLRLWWVEGLDRQEPAPKKETNAAQ